MRCSRRRTGRRRRARPVQVDADLVDQSGGEGLPGDAAGGYRHVPVAGYRLRLGEGAGHTVGDERERRVRVRPVGRRPVGHHEHRLADHRLTVPAVGQIEQAPADHVGTDGRPRLPQVGGASRGSTDLRMAVDLDSTVPVPVEQRARLVVGVGDETVQRHRRLRDHCAHRPQLVSQVIVPLRVLEDAVSQVCCLGFLDDACRLEPDVPAGVVEQPGAGAEEHGNEVDADLVD